MKHVVKLLTLLVLLMTAQQGAFVHELSHVFRVDAGNVRVNVSSVADSTCVQCPAFAQVVTPAFYHAFQIPTFVRVAAELRSNLLFSVADAPAPPSRSRGPPSLS